MCGIVGALSFKNTGFTVTESYINRMRETMAHRGPDGAGTWVSPDGKIGLGHRRLSIIDLSNVAGQPMSNADDSIWISFNGEIYNHAEIRAELERLDPARKWKTDHSDTEVIIQAYDYWGIDCIHKFRGMFAFAIWDCRKRELFLVRDRIGIKPLYYSIHHGRLVFASEIKALLEDGEQKRAVHEDSLFHFLTFLTTPAPQTLFDGIMKLPGGCMLIADEQGNTRIKRYWDVLENTIDLAGATEEEIADMILKELRTAVALRKVSDVPVGVFLSGGIDSSTNTALFSEGEGGPVKTFTIGYQGEYESYKNETHYARMMAEQVGAEYYERLLTQDDLFDFLPTMIKLQDEPIADPVCVPVYYVSKLARDNGVIVCQVGEGADELFWGYQGWKDMLNLQKMNRLPVPGFAKKMALAGLRMTGKSQTIRYEWLRRGTAGLPIFWGGAEAFTETQKPLLLSPRMRSLFHNRTSWEAIGPIYKDFTERAREKSDLDWMSYIDLRMRLPELLLMRVDKMSMGVSLEARVPFLDHKFVELAMSIPESVKTKDQVSKYILKKAVRGVIPDELIDRKKQGFGVPVYEWFFDRLGDEARRTLLEFCDKTDYFDREFITKLFDAGGNGYILWILLNFALWWNEYIGK